MAARLLTSGSPMRFAASITTLPPSAAPLAATTTAPPGTASTTTSVPVSASLTAISGALPGPSPEPAREPYTTSCPAARHRPPSVPPIFPVPMTAIFMLAPNRAGGGRIPRAPRPAPLPSRSPKAVVWHPEFVESRLQIGQAGMDGPALPCPGAAGGTLGVHRVTNTLERGERVRHLAAAFLGGCGLAHRVQPLGEVIGAALDVVPAPAGPLGDRALPFRRAHGAVQ